MNWKKSLFVVAITGLTVFSVTGCGQMEETVPAAEQTAPSTEQAASDTEQNIPAPEDSRPAPPDGAVPEGRQSDNGTMPMPPEGMTPGEKPPAPEMDLAAAAEKLGVTEEQLDEALGDIIQGMPDLAAVAEKLGVSEDSLQEALGLMIGPPPSNGAPQDGPQPGSPGPTNPEQ